jgi:ADP-ribose pyrophosphatase
VTLLDLPGDRPPAASSSSVTRYSGQRFSVEERTVAFTDTDLPQPLEVVVFPDIAVVVAVEAEQITLVRQYRWPIGELVLEVPGGQVDSGETPAETARRELREETGLVAGGLEYKGELLVSPHLSTDRTHVFYAGPALDQGAQDLQPGEHTEPIRVPLRDLRALVASGRICDAKTIGALVLCHLI